MVGVLAVGFVANLLVRPVAARFHEPRSTEPTALASDEASGAVVTDTQKGLSPLAVLAWLVVGVPLAYGIYQTW